MKTLTTKDLTQIAILTAMISIASYVVIPIGPVPITLQVFFFLLIPALLGSFKGTVSLALYVLLGLIGLPVFAGGSGGLQSLISPSFGYLIGYIILAPFVGQLGSGKKEVSVIKVTSFMTIAVLLLYAIGMSYQYLIMNYLLGTPITFPTILIGNLTVFLPLDIVKAAGAAVVYNRLKSLSVIRI